MTEFILRIFFTGLIALRPSADGTEVTVLLVNTPHEYALADGTALPHHLPIVVARAASCEGTCTTEDHATIAQYLYSNKTSQQAVTALNGAVLRGGELGRSRDSRARRLGRDHRSEFQRQYETPFNEAASTGRRRGNRGAQFAAV